MDAMQEVRRKGAPLVFRRAPPRMRPTSLGRWLRTAGPCRWPSLRS